MYENRREREECVRREKMKIRVMKKDLLTITL